MIGLDTNILVRIFVAEGTEDERKARAFLAQRSKPGAFYVSAIVLVELVWTLRSRYRFSQTAITEAIASLLDSDDFVIESRAAVSEALALQEAAAVDISDVMIAQSCLFAGCERTMTLDRAAAKSIPAMEFFP